MCKSILTVALIAAMCGASCSCVKNANPISTEKISTQMVGDYDSWGVFTFSCVTEVCHEDGEYYIGYYDPDGWDYDNLSELTGIEMDCMYIEIPDSIATEFLDDYAKWEKSDWQIQYALDSKYEVLESYHHGNLYFEISYNNHMED